MPKQKTKSLRYPLYNVNTSDLIVVLGICGAESGYEHEVNHCIGLNQQAYRDVNLLRTIFIPNTYNYRKKQKYRFQFLFSYGIYKRVMNVLEYSSNYNIQQLLQIRDYNKRNVYHLLCSGYDPTRNTERIDLDIEIQYKNTSTVFSTNKHKHKRIDTGYDEYPIHSEQDDINRSKLFRLLFNNPSLDLNEPDIEGYTPFILTVYCNYYALFKDFLSKLPSQRFNINHQNHNGNSALFFAAQKNNVPMVRDLCSLPDGIVNLNCRSRYSATPLIVAAFNNQPKVIEELLKYVPRININDVDNNEGNPLTNAVFTNGLESVKVLCRHPDMNMNMKCGSLGFIPLASAVSRNYVKIVDHFIRNYSGKNSEGKYYYDINSIDAAENCMLQVAIYHHYDDIVELLCKHPRLDFTKVDKEGNIPLVLAIKERQITIIQELLNYSSRYDINQCNNSGINALYIAIENNLVHVTQLLCAVPEINLRYNYPKRNNITPHTLAIKLGNKKIIAILDKYLKNM